MTDSFNRPLFEARARWYRDGCDGLDDRDEYFASGDCARDAGSDLDAVLSEVRVLEQVIVKLRESAALAVAGSAPAPPEQDREVLELLRKALVVVDAHAEEYPHARPVQAEITRYLETRGIETDR
jgi:hypothetical protein